MDRDAFTRVYRHARREALIVVVIWALALVWTVGYCYLRGYQHAPDSPAVEAGLAVERTSENLHTWLGLPDWVLFGILVPWGLCTAATLLFGLLVMTDDDLGGEDTEEAGHGH